MMSEAVQLDRLCKTCDELARWFSRINLLSKEQEPFVHNRASEIYASRSSCSLCYLICIEAERELQGLHIHRHATGTYPLTV
jgi:hypothetical protein